MQFKPSKFGCILNSTSLDHVKIIGSYLSLGILCTLYSHTFVCYFVVVCGCVSFFYYNYKDITIYEAL